MMVRALLAAAILLVGVCGGGVGGSLADSEFDGMMITTSMMEVGSASTISDAAARPMQDVAHLLVAADASAKRLRHSRAHYNVVSNHIAVTSHSSIGIVPGGRAKIASPKAKKVGKVGKVSAELVARMQQPRIHDAKRFGTKHPIMLGRAYVDAAIVGEDGKPYVPRAQPGLTERTADVKTRSPFAKYIHPPKVGSSADVVNKDGNTKLTKIERRGISSIQLRLKTVLDRLGANTVWDHTSIKNRRLLAEFEALKVESRTLLEEYELRTGVKTIAWQLQDGDIKGLYEPSSSITDIHFNTQPDMAGRPLQRPGDQIKPPTPSKDELKKLLIAHKLRSKAAPADGSPAPQEQLVSVAWAKGKNGVVKAKVNLRVVNAGDAPRTTHRSNRAPHNIDKSSGEDASARSVRINIRAPANENLVTPPMTPAEEEAAANKGAKDTPVSSAPKINL